MKFEQEAPNCTWMTHQLTKQNLEIQTMSFLLALEDLTQIYFEKLL
jgi:hypothetical protein